MEPSRCRNRWRDRIGAAIEIDAAWRRRLADAGRGGGAGRRGGGDRSRGGRRNDTDKEALHRESACVFADMESASIGTVARAHRLPFLVVRAVADTASDAVPPSRPARRSVERRQAPSGRLIAVLAKNPGQIRAMLILASRFRNACSSLEAVARHLPAVTADVA